MVLNIAILKFLINISNCVNDILIYYFIIMGISIFNYKEIFNTLILIGIYSRIFQLTANFILYKEHKKVRLLNILLAIPFSYGILKELNSSNFLLFYLYFINFGIRGTIQLAFNKKGTLLHELGHFFVSKEYKILNPELIDMNTIGDSLGRLIMSGNIEDVNPFEYITFLLSGYIAENYILYDKKEYSLREVRNILLVELESNQYSNSYLSQLIKIYLDDNKLQEAIANILKIIDKNKKNILNIARKNRYKKKLI